MELADFVDGRQIRVGAEAVIKEAFWKEYRLIKKHRLPKRYRNESIDARVRRSRTVHEAKMLTYLSENGLPVPLLFFLDIQQSIIYMQYIVGEELRNIQNPLDNAKRLGEVVGLMHAIAVAHGDLTLSNILVDVQGNLWLVDFGLSVFNAELEEKSVDIHLLERSVESTFPTLHTIFTKEFFEGYRGVVGDKQVDKIIEKVKEIRRRARYVVRS